MTPNQALRAVQDAIILAKAAGVTEEEIMAATKAALRVKIRSTPQEEIQIGEGVTKVLAGPEDRIAQSPGDILAGKSSPKK